MNFKKDRDLLEIVQQRAIEVTMGLKHLPYEEGLALFSLMKTERVSDKCS